MNHYIREQIRSMLAVTESFQSYCRAAALKDDGRIDRAEEKTLQRISRASDRFMKDLKKTLEDSEKGSESTMDRKEE